MEQTLLTTGVCAQTVFSAPKRGRRRGTTLTRLEKGDEMVVGESLLSCMACGKNFVSYGRLKSHEKTHSKTRPFKCIDCGKTFTVRYSLICHTRVHTRERPYHCNMCGSRFSQASSLKTHQIYKHTKEFPYICKFCGRGFISPGQKHEHVSRTHLKVATFGPKRRKQNTDCGPPGPVMTTAAVQTHLSLPPGPLY